MTLRVALKTARLTAFGVQRPSISGASTQRAERRLSASMVRSVLNLLFEEFPRLLGRLENVRRGMATEGLAEFHP